MDKKLIVQASAKFAAGFLITAALLFIPAGSFAYREAWLFLGILFIPMLIAGIILMIKNPELLRKRLNAKEENDEQKNVVILSGVIFLAAFIVAGLNFRFGWIPTPSWSPWLAAVIFLIAYGLYAEVLRENTYLSRTVEIQENQKVIDTGLYGSVRLPMYMSTILLFLSMPLVLGSVISFGIMLFYIPIMVKRIHYEEQVLENGLEGYAEYKKKVKYKVIPYIW